MLMSRYWLGLVLAVMLTASLPGAPAGVISSAAAAGNPPVILIVGDSLSSGYGVKVDATWVALLEKKLAGQGYGYRVVNASVSGETTGGGRARLARALQLHQPAIVILELGGNDGLRGLPLRQMRDNLEGMIAQVRAANARPVLVGMRIPTNYGPAYTDGFHAVFGELAKKHSVPLVPFFLEGVAFDTKLMQSDALHPNAQAQPRLLDNLWPTLQPLLEKKK
jgi:acyl-CoA thioesterase I